MQNIVRFASYQGKPLDLGTEFRLGEIVVVNSSIGTTMDPND
jgi:hypothetical protein